MYLTFSRGSWIALAVGLIAAVALDPRRLQLILSGLVIAPWVALSVITASRADALTTEGSTLESATGDGHVLLVYVAVYAVAAAVSVAVLVREERTREVGQRARAAFAAALVALAFVGAGVVWTEYGTPWSLADRAWSDFRSDPRRADDLPDRLFDLSSNGRLELWGISWGDFESSPVIGEGAGSFEQSFYERRESGQTARDGHSLYAETLGELGVIGPVLLLTALAVPVAAALLARWLQIATVTAGAEQQEALARAKALNPNEEQIRIVEEAVRNSSAQR